MGLFDRFKSNAKKNLTNPATKSYKDFSFPDKSFRQRVELLWKDFVKEEASIRQLIDNKAESNLISDKLHEILSEAFESVYFEAGRNGDKYDLILNLEGDWARLFTRVYFKKKAPKEVLEHWNIIVGRQSDGQKIDNLEIAMGGNSVSASDIRLWTEWKDGCVYLSVFCEKMLPLIRENINAAYSLLYILLDQAVGELAEMKYVGDIKFLDKPLDSTSLSLKELMENFVSNLSLTKEQLLNEDRYVELYSAYTMKPNEASKDGTRRDVFSGSTGFLPLMNSYYAGKTYITDSLEEDGAFAGYLFYPIDTFTDEERGKKILDLREAITAELEKSLPDSFMFIGGATGVNFSYIDFIAWDLKEVLEQVSLTAQKYNLYWISFCSFRPGSKIYSVK